MIGIFIRLNLGLGFTDHGIVHLLAIGGCSLTLFLGLYFLDEKK